jgi:hypothetical protein
MDNFRFARHSPGTLSYHQKFPNKPISHYGYPEKYAISIEYLLAKLLQVLRLRTLLMREAQHDTGAEAKGILHII